MKYEVVLKPHNIDGTPIDPSDKSKLCIMSGKKTTIYRLPDSLRIGCPTTGCDAIVDISPTTRVNL